MILISILAASIAIGLLIYFTKDMADEIGNQNTSKLNIALHEEIEKSNFSHKELQLMEKKYDEIRRSEQDFIKNLEISVQENKKNIIEAKKFLLKQYEEKYMEEKKQIEKEYIHGFFQEILMEQRVDNPALFDLIKNQINKSTN